MSEKICGCGKSLSEHPGGLFCCPFCGGTFFGESKSPSVTCLGCFAKGPQIINSALPTTETTIKAWNSRPGEQAARVEGLEAVREKLSYCISSRSVFGAEINEIIDELIEAENAD